jgi:hypothetical protein
MCEVTETGGSLGCTLKDLTVEHNGNFGGSGDVVGTVLGASKDGTTVYFVANGVLAKGAEPGHCARPEAQGEPTSTRTCNLYVEQFNGEHKEWEVRFIGTVSEEDKPTWGRTGLESLSHLTAQVSPSGRYLAFMSNNAEGLAGYANVDPIAKARPEQVFLYDANSQHTTCVSCAAGQQPRGVHDVEQSGEGIGLLVDRPHVWLEEIIGGTRAPKNVEDPWLAGNVPGWTPIEPNAAPYQSRYLNDEGRLYFNAADALVPQDTNGKMDVYQYEPPGIGSCETPGGCTSLISSGSDQHESAFLDASTNGNNVFFVTAAQLVSADRDHNFDVYDARVCTAENPCLESLLANPTPCEAEPSANNCKPPETPQAGVTRPPTELAHGPGNVQTLEVLGQKTEKPKSLTNQQKLTKALKACRSKYKHNKHKRSLCEKQAKAKYAKKSSRGKKR